MEKNYKTNTNDAREEVNTGRHAQQAALNEMAEKTRIEAWKRLEELIEEAKEFANSKANIHRELKVKLVGVGAAYKRLKKIEEETKGIQQRPSKVVTRDATTSPIIATSFNKIVAETRRIEIDTGSEGDGELTDRPSASRNPKRKKRESPEATKNSSKRKKEGGLRTPQKMKPPLHPDSKNKSGSECYITATSENETGRSRQKATNWQLVQSRGDKKKKQGQEQLSTQLTQHSRKERSRKTAYRPNALIIRPKDKNKYAEILTRVKKDVPDEQVRSSVDKIRKTAAGDLLIVLSKQNTDNGKELQKTIADLLKEDAEVINKGPQEDLEIRDLDDTTTKENVLAAIQKAAGEEHHITEDAVKAVRNAYRGTKIALVTLSASVAKKVLGEHGKIRIGWVNCRIKIVERPTRCFKCWHYGHFSLQCKSKVDRSKHCIKCGEAGHKLNECEKEARCVLCVDNGNTQNITHIAGCRKCPVYQAALQKVQQKQNSRLFK